MQIVVQDPQRAETLQTNLARIKNRNISNTTGTIYYGGHGIISAVILIALLFAGPQDEERERRCKASGAGIESSECDIFHIWPICDKGILIWLLAKSLTYCFGSCASCYLGWMLRNRWYLPYVLVAVSQLFTIPGWIVLSYATMCDDTQYKFTRDMLICCLVTDALTLFAALMLRPHCCKYEQISDGEINDRQRANYNPWDATPDTSNIVIQPNCVKCNVPFTQHDRTTMIACTHMMHSVCAVDANKVCTKCKVCYVCSQFVKEEDASPTFTCTHTIHSRCLGNYSMNVNQQCPYCRKCICENRVSKYYMFKHKKLSCGHVMHDECHNTWFEKNELCPFCFVVVVAVNNIV
jgi:hypothetical protein